MGVALLPPPEKRTEKKKKDGKKEERKHKDHKEGSGASRSKAAGAGDGAAPASPRGMAGSGAVQPRGAHGHGQAADGPAAAPAEPPKNRPGTVMLMQMRARGQRSEWHAALWLLLEPRSGGRVGCREGLVYQGRTHGQARLGRHVWTMHSKGGSHSLRDLLDPPPAHPHLPCPPPPAVTPFVERMAKRMDDMAEAAEMEVGFVQCGWWAGCR